MAQFPDDREQALVLPPGIVLLGDALHTAHYSIGSGTKLAMEDGIALCDALTTSESIEAGLARFERVRREEVEKTQHAADVSLVWYEEPQRFWQLEPQQLAFSLLTRSKQITYETRAAAMRTMCASSIAGSRARCAGVSASTSRPTTRRRRCSRRFACASVALANRVVVSPMCMYSADDGTVTTFTWCTWAAAPSAAPAW